MSGQTHRDGAGAFLDAEILISAQEAADLELSLTALLADVFALYVKTKNFHWHMSGPHFRDYHRLLGEHGAGLIGITDPIAERVRKIGGATIRSIGQIARLQRVLDNDAEFVTPNDMQTELMADNAMLAAQMRRAHSLCEARGDVATASLLETWIDEAEQRGWFLSATGDEASRQRGGT